MHCPLPFLDVLPETIFCFCFFVLLFLFCFILFLYLFCFVFVCVCVGHGGGWWLVFFKGVGNFDGQNMQEP